MGDHLRMSKYSKLFTRSLEVFMIKKVKNTVPWAYVISDFNGAEILETSYEKEFQKVTQREFRIEKKKLKEKVINYMSNGKAVNLFNRWINKEDNVT